ncbi:MAG TPA: hypothetical protein VGL47_35445 [Amycolatopsis sp.]|uniref:hypothetical protein n=1 Tax=Amycolatopsis sp. TaxID=37632 RepID=UPI002F3F3877
MTEQRGRLAAYWERQLDKLDEKELARARKLPGWRDRRHRRPLAVALGAADLVLICGASVFTLVNDWVFTGLWAGSLVFGGVVFTLLRILTGRMTGSFSRLLDEREREWRHRVTFVAYQTLVWLMILALVYGLVVARAEDGGIRGAMMLSALLAAGSTLPQIVLGWSLPDDDPDDFAEGMGND